MGCSILVSRPLHIQPPPSPVPCFFLVSCAFFCILPFYNFRNMLDKLFGWGKKKEAPEPAIFFGRYSDNNKPVGKVNR